MGVNMPSDSQIFKNMNSIQPKAESDQPVSGSIHQQVEDFTFAVDANTAYRAQKNTTQESLKASNGLTLTGQQFNLHGHEHFASTGQNDPGALYRSNGNDQWSRIRGEGFIQ